MLQNIGDKLKGMSGSGGGHRWIGYLILGALILVFVAWGPYAAVDLSFNQSGYAAKVNGEEVSAAEVNDAWRRRLPQLMQSFGGQLSEEQRTQYQQQLLESSILALSAHQHARKVGFRVSDAQVAQAYHDEQAFQVDGKFSAQAARSRLASVGMTQQQYESDLRKSLLTGQLERAIGSTDFLTSADSRRLLALLDEERELRFAMLQPEAYSASATVEPAAIEAWYKAHAEDFAVPESVRLDYAELTLADVAAAVVVPEDKLRERYEKDKARFMQPETRQASHILIAVDDATSDAKAAAQAKEIYGKLKAGGDFAALAKEFSKDTVSAEKGGDLGWAGREVYVKEFSDRLFAMQSGEISEPVKTQFGYHIIRLDGVRAEAGRSFDDVRVELTQTLSNELAATEFAQREDQLQERLEQGGSNLDQLTREFGLRRGTVEHFERGAGGLPLGSDAELNRMVFSDTVVGQHRIGGPVQLGEDRITVFQAQDHKPASQKPLDQVRDGIISELKREQGAVAALAAAEAAAARLKAGEAFDAVAASLKAKAEPARFVARSAPVLPVELRDAAFALPRPADGKPQVQALKLEGGTVALLQVTGSRVKEFSDNPQLQQLRTQRELQRYSVRDLDAYLADVVAKSKVRKNPQVFQQ